MNDKPINFGMRPPAQRAIWLGESSDFGIKTPNSELRTPNSKGISLIEVILVMVIIAILMAVVIPRAGFDIPSRASVEGAAYMIASDIRYAQEFAMANRINKGVTFTNGSSTYPFSPGSTGMDPSGQLPSGVTITSTSPSPFIITFNSLGEPIVGGAGWVEVTGGGQTKRITVTQYTGKVSIL